MKRLHRTCSTSPSCPAILHVLRILHCEFSCHMSNPETIIPHAPPSHDRVAQCLAQPNPQHLPEPFHGPATRYTSWQSSCCSNTFVAISLLCNPAAGIFRPDLLSSRQAAFHPTHEITTSVNQAHVMRNSTAHSFSPAPRGSIELPAASHCNLQPALAYHLHKDYIPCS